MKKIINGKKYDTETAEEIGEYWNGLGTSDFNWMQETLYRKKTGEFFMYGRGGGMSAYSQSLEGNSRGSGKFLIPLSIGEAKKWVESNMSSNIYEEVFGEVNE